MGINFQTLSKWGLSHFKLFTYLLLVGASHGICQENVRTVWEDVLKFDPDQLAEEHPVVLEGKVIFFRPDQPYFVLHTGSKAVPVFFHRSLENIQIGDSVKVTATTFNSPLNLPALRLTLVEQSATALTLQGIADSADSDLSPQSYYTMTQTEGVVSEFESIDAGYLLSFVHHSEREICLYLPEKQLLTKQIEELIGCKVKVKGLVLPFNSDFKGESFIPTIFINQSEDLLVLEDFLSEKPISVSTFEEFEINGKDPIVITGKLELTEGVWFLNHQGLPFRLEWNGPSEMEGVQMLCVGFPLKFANRVNLNPVSVFQPTKPDILFATDTISLRRSELVWKKSGLPSGDIMRSIKEIRASDQAMNDTPVGVDLQAVVTYHDDFHDILFIQDQHDGIYVFAADPELPGISPGSVVRVRGEKQKGATSSLITMADVQVVSSGEMIIPEVSTIEEMNAGAMDCSYIAIEATVQKVQRINHGLELDLFNGQETTRAMVLNYPYLESYDHLIDSKVHLTGTCGFRIGPNNKIQGTILYINDYDQMKTLEPTRSSFDQLSVERLTQEHTSKSGTDSYTRLLLKGIYLGQSDQNSFYFQTESQGLIIYPVEAEDSLAFQQPIEILGWPHRNGDHYEVLDALVRQSDADSTTINPPKSVSNLATSNLNRLVSRVGMVTQREKEDGRVTFHITSSSQHFTAILDLDDHVEAMEDEIQDGSTVEVLGILVSVPGEGSVGEIPAIKLQSVDAIQQLAPPSFFTKSRVLWMFLFAGALGLSAILWGLTLKRQVKFQTAEIRETVEMERQAKERFQRLFESALDMIFVCDTSARILSINQAGLDLIGADRSEIYGKSILNWILPGDRGKAEEALGLGSKVGRKLATEGEVLELRLETANGHPVYVELSIRGVRLIRGGYGYQCIVRNVDARKQSEAHLIKARDAYREANQAKSAFLAMMTHELRTPMNGVIGMTQMLLKSRLDSEQKDQANTILASSRGMMRLVLDLLDISKIESNKLILSEESFDIVRLTEEVLGTLSVEADRKQLDLTLHFQPRMNRQYRGDGTRLRQVLLNLIGNGIKFTERGGVAVKVMKGLASSNDEQIRIEVNDTGIGIGDAEKKDLFEAFVQLDSSETRRFGGAGLGLTICKRIVQAMGGVIGIEGQSKRGSSFWIEIPFKVVDKRSVIRTPPLHLPKESGGALLVTNSSLTRDYFQKYMNQAGPGLSIETSTGFIRRFGDSIKERDLEHYYAIVIDAVQADKDFLNAVSKYAGKSCGRETKWVVIERISSQSDLTRDLEQIARKLKVLKPLTDTTFHQICQFLQDKKSNANTDCVRQKESESLERGSRALLTDAGLKVLVAEDDPINQKLITLYLKKTGCEVVIVSDGQKVLQQLEKQSFDLVLMDCSMPVMDGFEATRKIRENPKFKDIRIIALTAHSLKGDRERCFAAGMDDYLPKPLNLDLLTEKLSRLVDSLS